MAFRDWLLALKPPSLPSSHLLVFVCVYICGSLITPAQCGTLPEGSPCSSAHNRIDKLSHRFIDDCDDKTFCSGSPDGICIPKRCRADLFPFGYKDGDVLPPLCDPGSFCPDEGGGCVPLVEVGRPCQMNQDRECAPPPNWQELASDWNFNGSLCLGSVCSCVPSFRPVLVGFLASLNLSSFWLCSKLCKRRARTTLLARLYGLHFSRPKRTGIHHYRHPPQLPNPRTLLQPRLAHLRTHKTAGFPMQLRSGVQIRACSTKARGICCD